MTKWTKAGWNMLEATINNRIYFIEKVGDVYFLYCDNKQIGGERLRLTHAKAAAEAHAAMPAPSKPGIHIDNIAGQQMVDILKRSFTTAQIQDFIDASPFDEPDTGAPEVGPL